MSPHKFEFFEQFRARLTTANVYSAPDMMHAMRNAHDTGWAGALTVLAHPRIARQARPFIELDRGFIEFDEMSEARNLSSHGEQLMIAVASSLYNSACKVDMAALAGCLDYTWLDYAIAGVLASQHRAYHPRAAAVFVPPGGSKVDIGCASR